MELKGRRLLLLQKCLLGAALLLALATSACLADTPVFSKFVYQYTAGDATCAMQYATLDAENDVSCTTVGCTSQTAITCTSEAWVLPDVGTFSVLIYYASLSDCQGVVANASKGQVWENGYCQSSALMFTCDAQHVYFTNGCSGSPVATYPTGQCIANRNNDGGYFTASCLNAAPAAPTAPTAPTAAPSTNTPSPASSLSASLSLALLASTLLFSIII